MPLWQSRLLCLCLLSASSLWLVSSGFDLCQEDPADPSSCFEVVELRGIGDIRKLDSCGWEEGLAYDPYLSCVGNVTLTNLDHRVIAHVLRMEVSQSQLALQSSRDLVPVSMMIKDFLKH